jgi:hypothetical protein
MWLTLAVGLFTLACSRKPLVDQRGTAGQGGSMPSGGRGGGAGPVDASADTSADTALRLDASGEVAADTRVDVPAVDAATDAISSDVGTPRLIAPMSTAVVTSKRPTLRWVSPAGAVSVHLDLCRDRPCATVLATLDVSAESAAPAVDLPAGVVFWRAYARGAGGVRGPWSHTWQFTVGWRSAPVDTSWGTTLDLNGDGFSDVIVGHANADVGTGKAYVYLGSAAGISSGQAIARVLTSRGDQNSFFAMSIVSAGDVNGDGYGDVIAGAPYATLSTVTGEAYVYLGGPDGVASDPSVTLKGLDGYRGEFGRNVCGAGDVNGDGYGDVVVGTSRGFDKPGRAYVYLGSASGITGTQTPIRLMGSTTGGDDFSASLAGAGDVDGDGLGDVVIGSNDNRAYVYKGSASGISTEPMTLTGPDESWPFFGQTVGGAGDVNGDGYADVAIGAPPSQDGRVYIYTGGTSGLALSATLNGPAGGSGWFGASLTGVRDVNGDGYADLIVGAPLNGGNNMPRAFVYFGASSGIAPSQQPLTLAGPDGMPTGFGRPVGGGGDVNGDGYADFIVSAPSAGRVSIFLGGATVGATERATLTMPGEFYGAALGF